jgi:hypothetical protein
MSRGAVIFMAVFIGLVFLVIAWALPHGRAQRQARAAYIETHKCRVVGYAGRDAIRVYQCTTGLFLENEL